MSAVTYLVTGGAGFIGANLVHHLLRYPNSIVVVLDRLTYAGNLDNLADIVAPSRYHFVQGDVADGTCVREVFERYRPDVVFHLAAESHVDRSIDQPAEFVRTNVLGTFEMLEGARMYWGSLQGANRERFRFVHVSTDEVFGSLGADGFFTEETRYAPNSPYAASKAGADHLARAYGQTYGLPIVTTNCSNNYGPYQFPEKLIPLVLLNALEGKPLPVYGDGQNIRDWLYVEDHCVALVRAAQQGRSGETYNVGGHNERTTLQTVHAVCDALDVEKPRADGTTYRDLIAFVPDRPGHDRRYAIDAAKTARELGWTPAMRFETGVQKTVRWYLAHQRWCDRIADGSYQRERRGLLAAGG